MPKVNINITATDDASSIIRKVTAALKEQEKGGGSLFGTFVKGNLVANALSGGFESLKSATIGVAQASLQAAGSMEQNEIAFKTMLGSSEKAKVLLQDMTKFAASTPFDLPGVVTAGKQMVAFGFTSEEIISNLRMLGDVSAGLSVPIGDMTYLFGQIKTQGKAMTQDLMQFANRGIPIYDELSKVLGVNTSQIRDLAAKGKIGFNEINQAFKNMTAEGSKFGGLMEEQSKSMLGMWSNFNDGLNKTITLMGQEMMPTAKALLITLNSIIEYDNNKVSQYQKMQEAQADRLKNEGSFVTAYVQQNGLLATGLNLLNGTAQEDLRISALQKQKNDYLTIQKAHQLGVNVLTKDQAAILSSSIDEIDRINLALKGQGQQFESYYKPVINLVDEFNKKHKQTSEIETKQSRERREALKYYDDLVYNSAMAEASDLKRIDLTTQKELDALKLKSKYLTDSQVNTATGIITSGALSDKDKLEIQNKAKVFDAISGLQTKFYTQSASEEANAIGEMSQTLTESFKTVASDVSKILNDIAADSRKSGLSMGDSFKIGASVATAALQSISAVMNMQQQMAQANYDRQLEMLRNLQDAELDALDAKYEAEQEAIDTKYEEDETAAEDEEAARLLDLEAYRLSLRGKTDAEIEAALEKKKLALKAKAEEKALAEKKAAEDAALAKKKSEEEAQIKKDYALQEWVVEVQAFKSKQDYDKKAVVMATALGIVQAWASAMMVPFPGNVIVGGVLTALMAGTAAAQLSQISSQSPPAPPAFASGVTNFEGGLAIVGEKGRELVNLPAGSNVLTNENTEKILSSGSSGPDYIINNIYLHGILTQQDIVDLRKASGYGGY